MLNETFSKIFKHCVVAEIRGGAVVPNLQFCPFWKKKGKKIVQNWCFLTKKYSVNRFMYKEVTRKIIISSFDDMLPGYFMATSVSNYFPNGSSIINGIITSCVKTTDPTVYLKTLKVKADYEDYFEMFCSLRWTFQFCKLMIKKGFEGKKVAPPHRILNEETVFLIPGQCPTQNLPLIIGDI